MTITELNQFLIGKLTDFEILEHEKPILAKQDATGIFKIEETVPTLIIDSDQGYFALIISGEREKIEFKQLKKLMNCRKFQLANPWDLQEKLNLIPGQVPLIGHQLPCIIDSRIFKYDYVYGGTGDSFFTLKIKPDDLVSVNNVIMQFD